MSVRTITVTAAGQATADNFLVPTGQTFEIWAFPTSPAWTASLVVEASLNGSTNWLVFGTPITGPGIYYPLQHGAANGGAGGLYYRVYVNSLGVGSSFTLSILNKL
jgi:hypothetical protein